MKGLERKTKNGRKGGVEWRVGRERRKVGVGVEYLIGSRYVQGLFRLKKKK
jgi:hypothetical protein